MKQLDITVQRKSILISLFLLFFFVDALCSAANLIGYVRSYDGQSIDGATVRLYSDLGDNQQSETTTDNNGCYNFTNIDAGSYRLIAFKNGFQGEETVLSITDQTNNLDIYLFPLGTITQVLCDFESIINMDVYEANGCNATFSQTGTAKRNGVLGGQLNYDFTMSGTEFAGRWVSYVIPGTWVPKVGGIQANNKIGFWLRADGEPYRLYITIVDANSQKKIITTSSTGTILGTPNARWRYVLFNIPTGVTYPIRFDSFTIDKVGESASSQTAGAFYIDDIARVYSGNGSINIEVINDVEEVPLSEASIKIYDKTRSYIISEEQTDSYGNIFLEDFPIGSFILEVSKNGYKSKSVEFALNADETVLKTVRLTNIGSIEGIVSGPMGILQGALIGYKGFNGEMIHTSSDNAGIFFFDKILAGDGELTIFYPGMKLFKGDVIVTPAENNNIGTIVLTPGATKDVLIPENCSVASDTPLSVILNWECPNSNDIGIFLVYRGTEANFNFSNSLLTGFVFPEGATALPGAEYSFRDNDIKEIRLLYYAILAVDINGNISSPAWVSQKPKKPYSPSEPQNETGSLLINNKPILSWLPVEGANKYRLELSQDPKFKTIQIVDNDISSNNPEERIHYEVTTTITEGKWYWRVCAVFLSGVMSEYTPVSFFEIVNTKDGLIIPYIEINPVAIHPNNGAEQVAIMYVVSRTAKISIRVFDTRGILIKNLEQDKLVEGIEEGGSPEQIFVEWDGTDNDGKSVRNGLYYIKFEITQDGNWDTKKVIKKVGVFR